MNANLSPFPIHQTRIGFHYYPDTLHYREADLQTWLPELERMGASWLVLQSIHQRAIPEVFINGLVQANIEPLVHFNLSLDNPPSAAEVQPIFEAYTRSGVHGVILFDRPNDRVSWKSADWIQQDLVERFLDRYLPLADLALEAGLIPVFPPLEPGGSYWDTAFLRSALESMARRKKNDLILNLVLAAYAWSGNHPLNWGAGGPARHPDAKPYATPPEKQDQRGFRIFDWYRAITEAALGEPSPFLLLGAGAAADPLKSRPEAVVPQKQGETSDSIARLLLDMGANEPDDSKTACEPVAEDVIAACFWLLTDVSASPLHTQAWYQEGGKTLPGVKALQDLMVQQKQPAGELASETQVEHPSENQANQPASEMASDQSAQAPAAPPSVNFANNLPAQTPAKPSKSAPSRSTRRPIAHYLLLPSYEWGVADWHLEVIRPFVKKFTPTVGFSLEEAALAARVTVVGGAQTFPDELIDRLQQSGCQVERIAGDGISIATQLSER